MSHGVLPPSTAIPYRADTSIPMGDLAWAMVAIAVVLVMLALLAVVLRRRGQLKLFDRHPAGTRDMPSGSASLRTLATKRLSRATTVHLVDADGTRYLVAESVGSCIVHPLSGRPRQEGEA